MIRNKILGRFSDFILGGWVVFLVAFYGVQVAGAITQYPPGSLLQPNDVTSSHIRDATILNVDISNSAAINSFKISEPSEQGLIYIANGSRFATSSNFKISTSTPDLYVLGGRIHATSTNFNGVNYTWPSADGTSSQVLQTNGSGTLSFVTSGASQITYSTTTSDNVLAGDALMIATSTATTTKLTLSSNDDTLTFGTAGQYLIAERISTSTRLSFNQITLRLKTNGTPTDSVAVWVESGCGASAHGTISASTTIPATSLTGTIKPYTLNFNATAQLGTTTAECIVVGRTGNSDGTNNYGTAYHTAGNISYGSFWAYNSSSWAENAAVDLGWILDMKPVLANIYRAGSWSGQFGGRFLGIAQSSANASSTVTIDIGGVSTATSTLTAGSTYFLRDDDGAIWTTCGTVCKAIGTAISTGALFLTPGVVW